LKELTRALGRLAFLKSKDPSETFAEMSNIGAGYNTATGVLVVRLRGGTITHDVARTIIEAVAPFYGGEDQVADYFATSTDGSYLYLSTIYSNEGKIVAAMEEAAIDSNMRFNSSNLFEVCFKIGPCLKIQRIDGEDIVGEVICRGVEFRIRYINSIRELFRQNYPYVPMTNISILEFDNVRRFSVTSSGALIPERYLKGVVKELLMWANHPVPPCVIELGKR
jgi:hypothetical protein